MCAASIAAAIHAAAVGGVRFQPLMRILDVSAHSTDLAAQLSQLLDGSHELMGSGASLLLSNVHKMLPHEAALLAQVLGQQHALLAPRLLLTSQEPLPALDALVESKITVPPLRSRPSDIEHLAEHVAQRLAPHARHSAAADEGVATRCCSTLTSRDDDGVIIDTNSCCISPGNGGGGCSCRSKAAAAQPAVSLTDAAVTRLFSYPFPGAQWRCAR